MTFITPQNCSTFIYYLADDANLFCEHKGLQILQNSIINLVNELIITHTWLCANKLPLNVEKSNFVLFHPQKKLQDSTFNLFLSDISN